MLLNGDRLPSLSSRSRIVARIRSFDKTLDQTLRQLSMKPSFSMFEDPAAFACSL